MAAAIAEDNQSYTMGFVKDATSYQNISICFYFSTRRSKSIK